MDEFRISNVARWTSDFIPPTEPYKTEIPVTGKAPYRWHKEDSPTIPQLQQYLANVAALRSVFESVRDAPNVPASPRKIKTDKANDIEKILGIIEGTILTLRKTFVACGPATCGGDYL